MNDAMNHTSSQTRETKMKHKTFADLKFNPHPTGPGIRARIHFKNGYGVSVVRFELMLSIGSSRYGSYTDNEQEWELAVLKNDHLTYDTPITDDVLGHLSDDQVTEIMKQVQDLPEVIKVKEKTR